MAVAERRDPYKNYRFAVEIEGIKQAHFRELTMPDSAQDPIEYREGTDKTNTVRKLSGLVKYGNVSLKWGVTDSLELFNWRKEVQQSGAEKARRSMSVILEDDDGNEVSRWTFTEAWPTKYDAPDLNATSPEVAIETLEITHEGMTRK